MMFNTPEQVLTEVTNLQLAHIPLMNNRTLINRLYNGEKPDSEEEQRRQNLKTNVNFLEASHIASNATNQLNSAFEKGASYFTVKVDKGPARMRDFVSHIITKEINKELKRCQAYRAARENARPQTVLHGIGPIVWRNRRSPCPSVAGIEDLLMPAGTFTSFENLDRFSFYREFTYRQLCEATQGKAVDPGWNKDYVTALLAKLCNSPLQPLYQGNRWLFPEKLQEDVKEGAALMASSSLPKLVCRDFFFYNEEKEKWARRIAIDYGSIGKPGALEKFRANDTLVRESDFLYTNDAYCDDWSEIFHCYIGNCSNVAPYRFHSVRSIGYLLYSICYIQNKLRNRLYDHMFQSLLTLFQNVSEENREKMGLIDLQNFGVLPTGFSMVPAAERHTIDYNLPLAVLNQGRQLMSESASAFVPDMAGPGENQGKEMTATEALIRQNTSVTLTSAVLTQMTDQSVAEYREICRRFCIKNNPDPMVVRFRDAVRKQGVPLEMLDCEAWDIIPDQTVGGGNKAVELTVTQAMMQELLPNAGPDAQRMILRRRALALTDNAEEAFLLFPDAPQTETDDTRNAQLNYLLVARGEPAMPAEGTNLVAYATKMIQMMVPEFQQAQGLLQNPAGLSIAAERVTSLINVGQHVEQVIQVIGRDKAKKNIANALDSQLQQIGQGVQKLAQQIQQLEQQQAQQQNQGGIDPETQAKIQAMMATAQTKNQIDMQKAGLKNEHKDIQFHQENLRKNAMTQADIQRKLALTHGDLVSKGLTTRQDLMHSAAEHEQEQQQASTPTSE
jgi:hypothetical protein